MLKQNFKLGNNIYPEDMIQEAIRAFEGYNISYSEWILSIEDENTQEVFDEFSNYCIALFNENSN